jgi:hypothetical protein
MKSATIKKCGRGSTKFYIVTLSTDKKVTHKMECRTYTGAKNLSIEYRFGNSF